MGGRHVLLGSKFYNYDFIPYCSFLQNGLFSSNVHVTIHNQIIQKDYPHLCPQTPCHTMQCDNQENQSCAGLWTRQRHKSHLGLLQSKLLFATSYQMVVKKFLPVYLMGDWPLLLFSHLFWSMSL